jgi:hypothetical protein
MGPGDPPGREGSMKSKGVVIALVALLLAVGCATSSTQYVPMPDQSVAVENPEMARVYLIRDDQLASSSYHLVVYDGENKIGELGMDEYMCWERPPGAVRLKVVTPAAKERQAIGTRNVVAGRVYYVGMQFDAQFSRATMHLLRPDDAKPLLEARKPAQVTPLP